MLCLNHHPVAIEVQDYRDRLRHNFLSNYIRTKTKQFCILLPAPLG